MGADCLTGDTETFVLVGLVSVTSWKSYQNSKSKWEFGSNMNYTLVKTTNSIINSALTERAIYEQFKVWPSFLMDWVAGLMPSGARAKYLGPNTNQTIDFLSIVQKLYYRLKYIG